MRFATGGGSLEISPTFRTHLHAKKLGDLTKSWGLSLRLRDGHTDTLLQALPARRADVGGRLPPSRVPEKVAGRLGEGGASPPPSSGFRVRSCPLSRSLALPHVVTSERTRPLPKDRLSPPLPHSWCP